MLRSLQLWSFEAFVVRFFWHFIVKTRDSPNWADIQHAFLISLIHWCHILCYKLRLQDFRLFCFRLTFEIWQKKETNLCLWFFKLKHMSSPRVWLSGVWGKNTLRQLVSFICICIIGHCKTTSEKHTVNDRLLLNLVSVFIYFTSAHFRGSTLVSLM